MGVFVFSLMLVMFVFTLSRLLPPSCAGLWGRSIDLMAAGHRVMASTMDASRVAQGKVSLYRKVAFVCVIEGRGMPRGSCDDLVASGETGEAGALSC